MGFVSKLLPIAGAAIGSVVPGVGTAIGASVGGALGAATSGLGQTAATIGSTLAQTGAAGANIALQNAMYQQQQKNIAPYLATGSAATGQVWKDISSGALGQPFAMTQDQLNQMPGYQFALGQGLESVQNAAAARGLGVSGAALKGAANFATGLANQNFQTAFNDYWANQNNRFSMLSGLAGQGVAAATGIAPSLTQSAAQVGQGVSNVGNALSQGLNALAGQNVAQQALNPTATSTSPYAGLPIAASSTTNPLATQSAFTTDQTYQPAGGGGIY